MKVVKLFSKAKPRHGVSECESLALKRGYGIAGDCNAFPGSPRQVLLIDKPTLDRFDLQPGQLRENILVDAEIEHLKSGQILQIGQETLVRITFLCEPCAMVEQLQPGLVKKINGRRGLLGIVVKDGLIKTGDEVKVTAHQLPEIPENTRGKFDEFAVRIPVGKVVRTSDLVLALGMTNSFYRTIPALLKKSAAEIPIHRVVAIDGSLLTKYMPQQQALLVAEGVEVVGDRVPAEYFWEPQYFHELGSF